MPKMKTHSGSKKRFKMTGSGKYELQKAAKRHLLIKKSRNQKKLDQGGKPMSKGDKTRMNRLLPYGI